MTIKDFVPEGKSRVVYTCNSCSNQFDSGDALLLPYTDTEIQKELAIFSVKGVYHVLCCPHCSIRLILANLKFFERLTTKLWKRDDFYLFWCQGCDCGHIFKTPDWQFNQNIELPSVTPSVLNHSVEAAIHCHIFIKDGNIQYLSDCNHPLAGQTLPMQDIPLDYGF
jgi:hypothetical protein